MFSTQEKIMTMDDDRCSLNLLWWSFWNLYKYQILMCQGFLVREACVGVLVGGAGFLSLECNEVSNIYECATTRIKEKEMIIIFHGNSHWQKEECIRYEKRTSDSFSDHPGDQEGRDSLNLWCPGISRPWAFWYLLIFET